MAGTSVVQAVGSLRGYSWCRGFKAVQSCS